MAYDSRRRENYALGVLQPLDIQKKMTSGTKPCKCPVKKSKKIPKEITKHREKAKVLLEQKRGPAGTARGPK